MRKHRITVGLAVDARRVTAVWRGPGSRAERQLTVECDVGAALRGDPAALAAAFQTLQAELGAGTAPILAVAILPPLARIRRVVIPRMTDAQRRQAIGLATPKHFLGLPEQVVCAGLPLTRVGRRPGPVLAAVLPATLLQTVEDAAGALGWTIERFVPAHTAWLAAAITRWPELRRGHGQVSIEGIEEHTVLHLKGGSLVLVRRRRPSEAVTDPSTAAASLAQSLTDDGPRQTNGAELAARYAPRTSALELVPDHQLARHRRAERRVGFGLAAAAATFLLLSAGAYRWGISHQLSVVAQEQAILKPAFDRALTLHDSMVNGQATLAALASLEASATRWSAVLAQLSTALPDSAYLGALRADGDSVVLEGRAANAASVFQAVQRAPGIAGVRATGPIRQDLSGNASAVEQWGLAAHVDQSPHGGRQP